MFFQGVLVHDHWDLSKEPRSKLRSISPIEKVVRSHEPVLDIEYSV